MTIETRNMDYVTWVPRLFLIIIQNDKIITTLLNKEYYSVLLSKSATLNKEFVAAHSNIQHQFAK